MSGNEELESISRETELDKRVAELDKREKQIRKDIDAFNQEKEFYLKNRKEFEDFIKDREIFEKSRFKKLKRAYGLMKQRKKN
ncbi:hypothetical protein ACOWK8_03785 [Helicobacter pylori]